MRRFPSPTLATKDELSTLPPFKATEPTPLEQKVAVMKFFGGGRWTWYAVEADPETRECFGYVVSGLGPDCDEWGYFSLYELEAARFPPFGLPAERDIHWVPGPVPEVQR